MADLSNTESSEVVVADGAGVNRLLVNADGSINVNATVGGATKGGAEDTLLEKMFGVTAQVTLGASGTEARVLLLRNPAGSGKKLILWAASTILTNTVASATYMRFYVAPTITATGTAVAAHSRNRGGSVASVATPFSGPTASAVGTLIEASYINGGSAGRKDGVEFSGRLVLQPGQDLLVTGTPDGPGRVTITSLVWSEE